MGELQKHKDDFIRAKALRVHKKTTIGAQRLHGNASAEPFQDLHGPLRRDDFRERLSEEIPQSHGSVRIQATRHNRPVDQNRHMVTHRIAGPFT